MEKQSTIITVESKIYINNDSELESLQNYCSFYNFLNRKLFNILRNNENIDTNRLQQTFSKEHDIPVRLYKSIIINCKGQISSLKELNKFNINTLKSKLEKINYKLKNKKLKPYTKYNLLCKKNKLQQKINNIKSSKIVNKTFGSKKLYKNNFTTENKNEWKQEWNRKRNYNIAFIGSKDESFGNNLCQLKSLNNIQLRLPNSFQQKYLNLQVNFDHQGKNYSYLQQAIQNKQALSFKLLQKQNKKWYIQCSFTLENNTVETAHGTIGVDMNYDIIATCNVKHDGNYENFVNYKLDTEKLSSNRITNELSIICDTIVNNAKLNNKSITIEDLNLNNKKYDNTKSTNRKVSMIAYNKFYKLLKSKCTKSGIPLYIVNPAFTSIIGKYKYCKNLGISVHNSAALVIGRRSLKLNENIPSKVQDKLHCGENVLGNWKQWSIIHKSLQTCYPKGFSLKREHTTCKDNPILTSKQDRL